jgi:hypothetical protein
MEAFDAPAMTAPALLPDAYIDAAAAARPVRVRGDEPGAAVLLIDIDVQGLDA